MHEQDLKKSALTKFLPILDAETQTAEIYLREENAGKFAEVTDTFRLYDLLHRDEYRPVAAIRFHRNGESAVRVYFQKLHETEFGETVRRSEQDAEQGGSRMVTTCSR